MFQDGLLLGAPGPDGVGRAGRRAGGAPLLGGLNGNQMVAQTRAARLHIPLFLVAPLPGQMCERTRSRTGPQRSLRMMRLRGTLAARFSDRSQNLETRNVRWILCV